MAGFKVITEGKYVLLSHPEPTLNSARQRAAEAVKHLAEMGDLTSALIRANDILAEEEENEFPTIPANHYRPGRRKTW